MFYRISFLILLFAGISARAQSPAMSKEALQQKLLHYSKANPQGLLFVHTDKTVYTNNEIIWFSAYLVSSGGTDLGRHTVLSVSLVRESDRSVYMQDKYALGDGVSFGSMLLPDSIPPGNYLLNAFTDVLSSKGEPLAVFTQALTIKSVTQNSYALSLKLLDTVVTGGAVRARLNVEVSTPKPKEKLIAEYSVGRGEKQLLSLADNSAIITIPVKQLAPAGIPGPALLASVKYGTERQYLSLKLPETRPQGLQVRFFPEGGNLAAGSENTLAWEAVTGGNSPVSLSGIVLRDGQPVDTVGTGSYGIGTFSIRPEPGKQYSMKIAKNSFIANDTIIDLPRALNEGIALHLARAIVNDTLDMTLSAKTSRKVNVLVHNYRELFAAFEVDAKPGGTRVSLIVSALPKGIATVTVLDNETRPLAERIFFAHYDQKVTGSVAADKLVYNKKDSVRVKLKLTDQAGRPVQGLLSVAAVQDNRIEGANLQDIESYVYLNHHLPNLPRDPQGRGYDNRDYLEDIFLVRGWRKFTWQDLMNSTAADTLDERELQSPVITGTVKLEGRTLRRAAELTLMGDSVFNMVTTGADGSFTLELEKLLATEGSKIYLSVNGGLQTGYSIAIHDPYTDLNRRIAERIQVSYSSRGSMVQSNEQQISSGEKPIVLQTVTIKASKADDALFGRLGKAGANACGDDVCGSNILNCPNHRGNASNTQPVKGRTYRTPGGGQKEYTGCIEQESEDNKSMQLLFKVKGIYMTREFYGADTSPAGLPEPQYISTLFWKPGLITNEKGEAAFTFSTGDITGKYRIIVQGVGTEDMIHAGSSFTVK